ncbi:glycosyltransferase family 2 protein [uncultured Parasutterella sp.]|uniref:glycosyltransferase family 2 protein n=1 Tax=uncultured Parasutterella sp. TaxID=1263098 RepID=UPI00259156DA|nr:glycosyltransferase family 2 protein [uncultured Parasutterella sp.]
MQKNKVVAYVMTKNEESIIGQCIDALKWTGEIVIADTGSTDKTIDIAKEKGCRVIHVDFKGFGPTRNEIINQIDAEWIVCFDADEICTEGLANEILEVLKNPQADAYLANRLSYMLGNPIYHSGWFPDYRHAVLFRKGKYRYTERTVHESYICDGKVEKLQEIFAHMSIRTLNQLMQKEAQYTRLGAENLGHKKVSFPSAFCHAFWSFVRHYVIRKGFLDGWRGFLIASSDARSCLYKYLLVMERQKGWSHLKVDIPRSYNQKK